MSVNNSQRSDSDAKFKLLSSDDIGAQEIIRCKTDKELAKIKVQEKPSITSSSSEVSMQSE